MIFFQLSRLHLVQSLRMKGAILPLPHTPSWRAKDDVIYIHNYVYRIELGN
jgi:hypothetical protein